MLLRYGGADGAILNLGSTVVRQAAVGGPLTGVRTYQVAGINIAERVSGTSNAGLWWLSADALGSVGLQINAATGATKRRWIDPFGNARGGATDWSSPFGFLNALQSGTGLIQLGARAYDPAHGIFTSVDPLLRASDPRHTNAYSYSFHSPVSYSDADGLAPKIDHPTGSGGHSKAKGKPGGKKTPPPAPGNTAGNRGSPEPQAVSEWWNPTTWTSDTWVTIGAIALTTVATVAIGACVVATAGICAAVGVVGGMALAGVVGGTVSTAAYLMTSGEKSAEGAVGTFASGAASNALLLGAGALLKPVAAAAAASLEKGAVIGVQTEAQVAMAAIRDKGIAGELLAGIPKNTARIPSASGTASYRIPDGLSASRLTEVKNVGNLGLTPQLKDFAAYAGQETLEFVIVTRRNTVISPRLQDLVNRSNGSIRFDKVLPE